jgi:hypothetical protein
MTGDEVSRTVPTANPVYTWNLAGYRRHTFRMIQLIEAGQSADWPF